MRRALATALMIVGVGLGALPAQAEIDRPVSYLERDGSGRYRPVYQVPGSKILLANRDSITAPAISPDGSRVAFSGVVGNGSLARYAIYTVGSNASGLDQLTTGSYGEFDPSWSPDGSFIVYSANTSGFLSRSNCCRIARVTVATGTVIFMTNAIGAVRPDYSPNGALIAFDNPSGVWTMPGGGGSATLRASASWDPTFSPDSQRIAFVARSGSSHVIRSMPVGGGAPTTLYTTTQVIESPVWVGDRIYFVQHLGVGYDGSRSITHRSIPATGGAAVTETSFSGNVAELSVLESDPAAHLVGDATGGGDDDITTIAAGRRVVQESSGSDFAADDWGSLSPSTGWSTHVSGDFNEDGRIDTAGFRPSDGTWRVSRSTGSAYSTTTWANFSTNSGWAPQLVGDFDGDGRDDIANYFLGNGTWWVSRSTGSAFTTGMWADFSTATGWQQHLVGDFNEDGRDDIASYHPSNGTWWVSRSTGTRFVLEQWADFSTATGWATQKVGDFNNDGRDDIASYHPSNGTWWVSRSTGSSFTLAKWADFSTNTGWSSQLVGDFNEDGRHDIANFHPSNGTWWVSLSTGTRFTFGLWADFSTPTGWKPQMVGDFDGDGRDDIANYFIGNNTWWVSRSTGSGFTTLRWAP